jgi:hypothetical protein
MAVQDLDGFGAKGCEGAAGDERAARRECRRQVTRAGGTPTDRASPTHDRIRASRQPRHARSDTLRAGGHQPCRQCRRDRAGDEGDGFFRPGAGAAAFCRRACHDEAVAMASGAADILARARTVDTLGEALQGCTYACATAMTPRDFGPPTAGAARHLPTLAAGPTGWPSCSARAHGHVQRRRLPLPGLPEHPHARRPTGR